ncbi:MAG: DUF3048 domain-containing protein, partial [Faecalibacterium sp.]|nr:DUF3048 domain-containing protein [Faecalibacterium sp.]
PSPTPVPPYDADVLTGEKREPGAKDSRIIGVMINNMCNSSFQNARPQRGLSAAKMLIEIKVEGGITRFCALFNDTEAIPELGPIRSGRDQFLQLIMPWQAVYYHDGESVFTTRFIKDWEYWELNFGGLSYFNTPTNRFYAHRDKRGRNVDYCHTEFTSGEEIQKAIDKAELDMTMDYKSTFFIFADYRFGEYNSLEGCDSAISVTLRHSSAYRTYFDYDESTKLYMMSQYGADTKTITETRDELNGEQLGFTNLVVLFTEIEKYPGDSKNIQNVDYRYGGVGYMFTNGRAQYVMWRKGSPGAGLILLDPNSADEAPIVLNPGKTYLAFVDLDEYDNFHYEGNEETAVTDDLTDAEVSAEGESEGEGSEEAAAGISTT